MRLFSVFRGSLPRLPYCRTARLIYLHQARLMDDPEQTIDYLEQQIPGISAAAVTVAYLQALASGQIVLVRGENGIYQVFADGTKKLIKRMEQPLCVPVGTRVRLP